MSAIIRFWSSFRSSSWTLCLPAWQHWLWPQQLAGMRLTFGIWARITQDTAIVRPPAVDAAITVYEPLDENEIRIFILEPDTFGAPLRGRFEIQNIQDDTRPYEAMSYCWELKYGGTPPLSKADCNVFVNDLPLFIKANGYDGLQHFRSTTKPRRLWIDALCINGDNQEEERAQLRLMGDVYKRSMCTLIWAGPALFDPVPALKVLAHLASNADFLDNAPWIVLPTDQVRQSLAALMACSYFERTWVVQEVVVAQSVSLHIGSYSISWPAEATRRFYNRLKLAEISPDWERSGLDAVDMKPLVDILELAYVRSNGFRPQINTLEVIHNLRKRKVTDRRDRVFAVMGLTEIDPTPFLARASSVHDVFDTLTEQVLGVCETDADSSMHDYQVKVGPS